MPKILRGFVKGVIEKGDEKKPWYVVGIESLSTDRDGFETSELIKFMVAGNQAKDGLQNVYRQLKGAEVFAPYRDEIDEYNGTHRIRYSLTGVPLRLADQVPQQDRPAVKPAAVHAEPQAKAAS